MSSYFQPHGSEQFRSDREPDALVDSDPDGAYDYDSDVCEVLPDDRYAEETYVPETDQERDFEEEKFNAQLMREE